ncbi:hypothetical protein CEXT_763321, partial [Caerostris extrusa]
MHNPLGCFRSSNIKIALVAAVEKQSLDARPIVIPILSCVLCFPVLAFAVICALRYRAIRLRQKDRLKRVQSGVVFRVLVHKCGQFLLKIFPDDNIHPPIQESLQASSYFILLIYLGYKVVNSKKQSGEARGSCMFRGKFQGKARFFKHSEISISIIFPSST